MPVILRNAHHQMKRLIRSPFLFALSTAAVLLISAGVTVWVALQDLPSIDALKNYQPPQSTIVLDRFGQVVGRFFDERRTVISIKKLPNHVKMAFVAAEDGDFFVHRGIDYFGLLRAILLEIKYKTIGGRRVGGSTITQQTARAMFLSSAQTYVRKIKEMVLAQRIEHALSKEQILHLYLNQIYFGNGAYGIEEAAHTYFGKPASKLLLFEAAALASVPKSPNRINPFSNAERLQQRQHYVLDQMVKHEFVTQKDAEKAKLAPLFSDVAEDRARQFAPYFLRTVKTELLPKISDEFIRRGGVKVFSTLDINMQKNAEDAMRNGLLVIDKRYGYRGPIFRPNLEQDKNIKGHLDAFKKRAFVGDHQKKIWDLSHLTKETITGDLDSAIAGTKLTFIKANKTIGARVIKINDRLGSATIDLGSRTGTLPLSGMSWARPYAGGAQKPLPAKVSDVLKGGDIILVKIQGDGDHLSATLEQEPLINGGLVALDVATGGVLAMVGGYDFERSPFNRITQAKRQPGSGIKPLIYALAIDRELATAASIITDVPKAFLDPGTDEFWRPRNSTNKYLGDITLRRCLRSSVNTCTITLLEKIGLDSFLSFANDLELVTKLTPYPRNLTIALGSAENYPIDVANAMRILANGGVYSPYHMIDGIKHVGGERENMFVQSEKTVLRPESAFIISHILQDVVSETKRNRYLADAKCQLAGKTGTTNNARSTWFFGYSPKVLALVFIGYDDNRSIGSNEWGITTAFPIWAKFMNSVPEHQEALRFLVPDRIEWRYVDRVTGRARARELDGDPNAESNGLMEAFIAGTAPDITAEDHNIKVAPEILDETAFAP